jgi:hypothetical protein
VRGPWVQYGGGGRGECRGECRGESAEESAECEGRGSRHVCSGSRGTPICTPTRPAARRCTVRTRRVWWGCRGCRRICAAPHRRAARTPAARARRRTCRPAAPSTYGHGVHVDMLTVHMEHMCPYTWSTHGVHMCTVHTCTVHMEYTCTPYTRAPYTWSTRAPYTCTHGMYTVHTCTVHMEYTCTVHMHTWTWIWSTHGHGVHMEYTSTVHVHVERESECMASKRHAAVSGSCARGDGQRFRTVATDRRCAKHDEEPLRVD